MKKKTNPPQGDILTDRPVPYLDADIAALAAKGPIMDGYAAGIVNLADLVVESRSASKSLLREPISLKDTPHSEMQAYLRKPGVTRRLITEPSAILEMSMRLHGEEQHGGHVRDVQADIFERPFHYRPTTADFDGDTPYGDNTPRHKLPTRVRMLREFNNMSLAVKNKVRKLQRKLFPVVKAATSILNRNMKKLHDK